MYWFAASAVFFVLGCILIPFHAKHERSFVDQFRARRPNVVAQFARGAGGLFPTRVFSAHFLRKEYCAGDDVLEDLRSKLLRFYWLYVVFFVGVVSCFVKGAAASGAGMTN